MTNEELLQKLQAEFKEDEIEWRVQRSYPYNGGYRATALAYITNRAIQNRLDEVIGAKSWKNEYKFPPDGSVLCTIYIYNEEIKEWVGKTDGADKTDIEAIKGGLSSAMKRAAVQWGIGRYLYNLKPVTVNLTTDKHYSDDWTYARIKTNNNDKLDCYFKTPKLIDGKFVGDSEPPESISQQRENVPVYKENNTYQQQSNTPAPVNGDVSNLVLNFGKKHNGKMFKDVPEDYLKWMVENKTKMWEQAQAELARRSSKGGEPLMINEKAPGGENGVPINYTYPSTKPQYDEMPPADYPDDVPF